MKRKLMSPRPHGPLENVDQYLSIILANSYSFWLHFGMECQCFTNRLIAAHIFLCTSHCGSKMGLKGNSYYYSYYIRFMYRVAYNIFIHLDYITGYSYYIFM